ncbi:MAG: hypothetical protein FK732_07740 [Asgard group archaeon]|nr:hypothetical protein [Asgard group archaeon]
MGNRTGKIFFNVAVTITLAGLLLYFIQDIIMWSRVIEPMTLAKYGAPLTAVIADSIMLVTIILACVLLFIGFDKTKIFRVTIMMGALYLLTYTLANIFYPFYENGSWSLGYYGKDILKYFNNTAATSFICLLLLSCISLFVVIFTIVNISKEEITVAEKFSYVLTIGVMTIFDMVCLHWLKARVKDSMGLSPFPYYGFLQLPFILEMIFLMAILILIVANITDGGNEFLEIMNLVILNIIFFAIISSAVTGSILRYDISNNLVPIALGNSLILLGTVFTFIASIILIGKKLKQRKRIEEKEKLEENI